MLIEPGPLRSPGRSRLRRGIALAAIPLVLAGVVAGGLAGRSTTAPSPEPGFPSAVARGDGSAPPETTVAPPTDASTAAASPWPDRVLGLDVWSVQFAVDRRVGGDVDGAFAVVGRIATEAGPSRCLDVSDDIAPSTDLGADTNPRTFCDRPVLLTPTTARDRETAAAEPAGPHLHAILPAGIPADLPSVGPASARPSVAILIATFPDRVRIGCAEDPPTCDESIRVERLIWLDGIGQGQVVAIEPAIHAGPSLGWRPRTRAEVSAIPTGRAVLSEVLVRPSTLSGLDPVARATVTAAASADGRWWYVRLLRDGGGGTAGVAWAVIDDRTGSVLAAGAGSRA